jgi:putative SOS response-associated peptidase YedK
MCYGWYPVTDPDTGWLHFVDRIDFYQLYRAGKIVTRSDGFHYAKDTVGALVWRGGGIEAVPMRWDLVPRNFLQKENPSLAEVIKKKNSRRKDPATGRPVGFSSYNARVETVANLVSFRMPWQEGLRMASPILAFRERANMDEAPAEFRNREWNIHLHQPCYLAGIWDAWRNPAGESMESCSIITLSSEGNPMLRGIWHERCPVILEESQVEEWLDPLTTPTRAMEMCRLFPAGKMEVKEVGKPKNPK